MPGSRYTSVRSCDVKFVPWSVRTSAGIPTREKNPNNFWATVPASIVQRARYIVA